MNAGAISNRVAGVIALLLKSVDFGCAALHGACNRMSRAWPGIRLAIIAQGGSMKWETPSFTDMRFGFEITMYIATR